MLRFLAQFISVVCHPLFVPLYAILILLNADPFLFGEPLSYDFMFILRTVVLNALFFPLITVMLMRGLNFIDSYEIPDRRQRILVYIPTIIFYSWTYTVFLKSEYHVAVGNIMLGATLAVSLALVINALYAKISMHTLGMGGLMAVALFVSRNIAKFDLSGTLMLVILVAGAVGTARLLLRSHTYAEVYYGYITGFLSMAIPFIFLK